MSNIVELECPCGEIKGSVEVVPNSFFHVHCLCCDCQEYADYLGNKKNILDEHGGSELFQTYPELVKITQGQDKISAIQLKESGIYRWHTSCCNMPIANTMGSAKIPFVGVSVKLMKFSNEQDKITALGPVVMKAFGRHSIGKMPKDTHAKFPLSFMPKIIGFMLKGVLKKRNSPSPFFKENKAIVNVKVLSKV